MLRKLNEEMRNSSHAVLRSAIEDVFNHYFNDESLNELSTEEIQLLSDVLTARLTKEVNNEILYRTHKLTMN